MSWSEQDYAITHVRYNDEGTRIQKVKQREVIEGGDKLDEPETKERSHVVTRIDVYSDNYVTTIYDEGAWQYGDEVHVVEVGGHKWIRTDPNQTAEDNLGNLPAF